VSTESVNNNVFIRLSSHKACSGIGAASVTVQFPVSQSIQSECLYIMNLKSCQRLTYVDHQSILLTLCHQSYVSDHAVSQIYTKFVASNVLCSIIKQYWVLADNDTAVEKVNALNWESSTVAESTFAEVHKVDHVGSQLQSTAYILHTRFPVGLAAFTNIQSILVIEKASDHNVNDCQ